VIAAGRPWDRGRPRKAGRGVLGSPAASIVDKTSLGVAWMGALLAAGCLLGASGCSSGSAADPVSVDGGAKLFASPDLSSSGANFYTCATCHDTSPADSATGAIKPGAVLAGVTQRKSFWGGMENDLLAAVNDCLRLFMYERSGLSADDIAARSLYAFLVSLEPGAPAPVAFSVLTYIEDVPRGDAQRGLGYYQRSCARCHGAIHTGEGRIASSLPILPDGPIATHAEYDLRAQRLVFIEKTRHGGFFGYVGLMPPFSQEVLGDAELGDILEVLGVRGLNP